MGLLLLPHHARYLYADDKLLTAFLAVEAYHRIAIGGTPVDPDEHLRRVDAIVAGAPEEHRGWARQTLQSKNTKGQRRQLDEVIERAGTTGTAVCASVPGFAALAVKCRQQVAHPGPITDHAGVRYLASSIGLRWLLRHCLLADLCLPDTHIDHLIGGGHAFQQDMALLRGWSAHLV